MKKAVLLIAAVSCGLVSCGPSEEERQAGQAEREAQVNEKINEIMEDVEETELIDLASDSLRRLDTLRIDSMPAN